MLVKADPLGPPRVFCSRLAASESDAGSLEGARLVAARPPRGTPGSCPAGWALTRPEGETVTETV